MTDAVKLITIGIGAGSETDGQVTVLHDAIGITNGKIPPFATKFCDIFCLAESGIKAFIASINQTP